MSRSANHHGPNRGARYTKHRKPYRAFTPQEKEIARAEPFHVVSEFDRFKDQYARLEAEEQ